ncbi:phosphatidylinositol 3,4,5-trisphosphate 5-phosphatase 2-like isoform X1 [Malaclemys terrapin pileata]|uniref:phosphatidylinositol 3,4,5-trisphosphate 5-phosphatase 2-like isoform X1 n=1 Tax=Malaclemys terrapin pileata TaxID=2991368 RepID=UPI0023A8E588|nr:phosphatidylinositol 3,4,5-trisphosphate 5-phosphatase 2-like isoform X1 [Malaclemys terrapin pileata]XP_053895819.1 phosphatidylinositol 3,4,5-trisphosphate 5-phosphatase 2-like isoform X1 [Malaclemys terrapin pileata]XP_053895820.1 phosphatidylinositol 3,4,5-trisphosphate 5-phosphatase 2-like isoform X1 [Malaclemys terrapin pileata]
MTAASWYHRDISRVVAEDLLAKAGKDGCFLVRDSESVSGAYALCLLFQRHVHTYRILPDEEGLLSVQTIQGIQAKCFRTLTDLIGAYQQPNNGLVIPLLYPVNRAREPVDEDSDGEDGRASHPPSLVPHSGNIAGSTSGWVTAQPNKAQISQQLQLRLQEQVHSSPASDFMGFMAEYLSHHLQLDLEALRNGNLQLKHLSTALVTACRGLHSEIDFTLAGLETLAKVFDPPASPRSPVREQGLLASDPDLELLLSKISTVNHLLSSLEKKVLKTLQETVTKHKLALPSVAVAHPPAAKPMAVQNFEVKVGKTQRASLTVDVESGTMAITKRGCSSPEETISQDKILQLIKYQSMQSKVRLVYDRDQHRSLTRDFIFQNARKREAFCQLLQLMKIQHSNLDEPDLISVYVGTWNMGSAPPPRSMASWLTSRGLGRTQDETTAGIPHDIYVIGTQENSLGDREWVEFLRASLKTLMSIDFRVVALQCLWSIKIVVLVKPEHECRISHVNTSSVKTGIANTLGNKGAVGVSFLFNGTSFGFVNCHLASGSEKTHRRNQNYSDILRSLVLGDKRLSSFDLTLRFTHLFWFGDLNYRLDMEVQDILAHVNKKEFEALLAVDQLTLEREKNKVFLRFSEEDISFPPTYRYERGSRDSYVWQKFKTTGVRINVPSWCDRILWKSRPETHVLCNSYGCTDDIVTSDHSPVFATFEVGVTSQFVPRKAPGSSPESLACIEWDSIEVIVKTASRSKCYIEFHSYCLEESQRSGENSSQSSDIPGFLKLSWSAKQLPVLSPILSDLEYLLDQHLLLSIKGMDSCESYGECCIAMRSMIGSLAQQFETFLFHRGEETGSMRGWMKVRVPKDRRSTRERLYEWISFETDETESDFPTLSKPTLRAVRSRPLSLPDAASSYTNPAYFIFEGVPNTWAQCPSLSEPPYSPASDTQADRHPGHSPCRRLQSLTGAQAYSSSKEQLQRSPHYPVSETTSCGHQLSLSQIGRHKRPKSAILTRDPQTSGDCSLTALHMAWCLSDVDTEPPKRGSCLGPSQPEGRKNLLRHTRSALEPPQQSCWEGARSQRDTRRLNRAGEWPCGSGDHPRSVGRWLSRLGLEQYEAGLYENGWDDLEFFRNITDQDLLDAGVLSPTHRKLIQAKLHESSPRSLQQGPSLKPNP